MPYATNADLNPQVKKAHPTPHAQRVFRSAFNAAEATGKYDEATLFKIAHAAADKVSATKDHRRRSTKAKRPAAKKKARSYHEGVRNWLQKPGLE